MQVFLMKLKYPTCTAYRGHVKTTTKMLWCEKDDSQFCGDLYEKLCSLMIWYLFLNEWIIQFLRYDMCIVDEWILLCCWWCNRISSQFRDVLFCIMNLWSVFFEIFNTTLFESHLHRWLSRRSWEFVIPFQTTLLSMYLQYFKLLWRSID